MLGPRARLLLACACACALLGCALARVPSERDAAEPAFPLDAAEPAFPLDAGTQPGLVDAGSAGSPASAPPPPAPPSGDFVSTELGGYKLGPALQPGATDLQLNFDRGGAEHCSQLVAVVRDFRGAGEPNPHPDFEVFSGKKPTTGLLGSELGNDEKPVYASRCEASFDPAACPYGQMTTSRSAFQQWYRSTPDVNATYLLYLAFEANGAVYTFQSKNFFPLDGTGFGNSGAKRKHNFGFTTELHASFTYHGGERFAFTGDDDLWVFVNGKLAIDLGGLHPPTTGTLRLDAVRTELGLELGGHYRLDLFHAERHSASSNFRVDTTIEFNECGRVNVELL